MSKDLFSIRREYKQKELLEKNVDKDPVKQFNTWLDEAFNADILEPTAMTLSTSTKSGKPTARVVLLKKANDHGLTFFTNYSSRKGKELTENPYACLSFFWPELERQVRIEGTIKKTSPTESDEYFCSRPRGSQIGAVISPQSHKISKAELITKENQLTRELEGKTINRPEHWGGYRLIPTYLEFWQGRPNRLHDRIAYEKKGEKWEIFRLAP